MYGYLKYGFKGKTTPAKNVYRCYYCGLCCALKKNYGCFSTIFLSNDVVFLNMILSYNSQRVKYLKPQCCFWKRCAKISHEYQAPYWKKIAAFTLSLVYAKACDDVLDKNSFFSKIRYSLINALTKRAHKENMEMFEHMKCSMADLSKAEQTGADIVTQGELFSSSVLSAITAYVEQDLQPASRALVPSILKWLCFIDAVDDYEKDVKKKAYNPFFWTFGTSTNEIPKNWYNFFSENWQEVLSIYSDIYFQLHNSIQDIQGSKPAETEIICQMINRNMPQKLMDAMKGNRK